jgi:hypothetical protein
MRMWLGEERDILVIAVDEDLVRRSDVPSCKKVPFFLVRKCSCAYRL